ncbi:cytochrome P450 [Streptomyces sp. NPDC089799]|uniref:cytochrome P450 n=1 Tax=Streptomyces sp. NPDC089799 TaxID=3155066 RepID=UPI00343A62D3
MTDPATPARFPFPVEADVRPPSRYRDLLATGAPYPVQLTSGRPALLITRHEDVTAVLGDDRFSRAGYAALARPLLARDADSLPLVTADAPHHTRRRRAVQPAFTARRVRRLLPRLEQLADELLDGLTAGADHGTADLVGGYTVPFAMRVICEVLGVPFADADRLRREVDVLMSTTGHTPEEAAAAQARMNDYFTGLIAEKRRAAEEHRAVEARRPADARTGTDGADPAAPAPVPVTAPTTDVLTALVTQPPEDPDRHLAPKEAVALASGMLMAGYETTGNSFAMCVLLLLRHPALTARLRADPALIPAAVEEMLRWTSLNNTGGAPHLVTEDTVLGGCPVRAGQVVVPLTDAANRDPARFADPDAFDPDRPDAGGHLAFGHGRHLCPGAELARAELRIGIAALLRRFPVLELAATEDELDWRRTMFINGVWRLPVRWALGTGERPE